MTTRSIESPVLLAVVELEPGTYATQPREFPKVGPSSEYPEPWTRYWNDCLADAGIVGLEPISPGSWLVSADELARHGALGTVLAHQFDSVGFGSSDGDDDDDDNDDIAELISPLSGGYALHDGDELLLPPTCCGDLGDLESWSDVAPGGLSEETMLWIGHPWLMARTVGGDLELRETQEYDLPVNPRTFRTSLSSLRATIAEAEAQQRRLRAAVAKCLEAMPEVRDRGIDIGALADHLSGLRLA